MCGLARTTTDGGAPTFLLMGGDACHHAGEFRPTEYLPLPTEISPNPLDLRSAKPCPGALFEAIHRHKKGTEPFFEIAVLEGGKGVAHDAEEATRTIRKVEELDGCPDVFVAMAHDHTLLDVVGFFPETVNQWREMGWGERARWVFLKDFMAAVD